MPSRDYTDEQRSEALEAYDKHGAVEAARLTGIPRATISSWARRYAVRRNEQQPAEVEDPVPDKPWEESREDLARGFAAAAAENLRKARQATNGNSAKGFMFAAGIAARNAAEIETRPREGEGRRLRIAESQAQQLADAMRGLVVALGLDPADEKVKQAMRGSLKLAGASEVGEPGNSAIDEEITLLLNGLAAREREKAIREAGDTGLAVDVAKMTGLDPDPEPADEPRLPPNGERELAKARAELEHVEAELAALDAPRTVPVLLPPSDRPAPDGWSDATAEIDNWARDMP